MNYLTTEDGKPIKPTNPLSVKDEGLGTSVQSVEAELAALNASIGEVQATPTPNTLLARIKALETELAAIRSTAGIKKIVDALPAGENTIGKAKITDGTNDAVINADGSQLVQVSGSNMEYYVKKFADAPAASSVALGAMLNVIGTDDVWQSNGTDWLVI